MKLPSLIHNLIEAPFYFLMRGETTTLRCLIGGHKWCDSECLLCGQREVFELRQKFMEAITEKDISAVKKSWRKGIDIDSAYFVDTPLIAAINRARGLYDESEESKMEGLKIIEFLLSRGADPNKKISSGYTPLMEAECRPDIVEILLKAGADPERTRNAKIERENRERVQREELEKQRARQERKDNELRSMYNMIPTIYFIIIASEAKQEQPMSFQELAFRLDLPPLGHTTGLGRSKTFSIDERVLSKDSLRYRMGLSPLYPSYLKNRFTLPR